MLYIDQGSMQSLLSNVMKDFSVKLTLTIKDRLQTFKRQITDEVSSSLKSVIKRLKRNPMQSEEKETESPREDYGNVCRYWRRGAEDTVGERFRDDGRRYEISQRPNEINQDSRPKRVWLEKKFACALQTRNSYLAQRDRPKTSQMRPKETERYLQEKKRGM